MKNALRRASTQPDGADASRSQQDLRTVKRTFSTASTVEAASRRPSLASFSSSLRLGRSSKKLGSISDAPTTGQPNRLGQLFFELPVELHAIVVSFLEPRDILTLRQVCHTTRATLDLCAPAVQSTQLPQLARDDYQHVSRLHPSPLRNHSLNHYLSLLRRHTIITQTTETLTSFMQMKIYTLPPTRQHQQATSITFSRCALLAAHLYPALWTVDHYLSTYRDLLLHAHPSHSSLERSRFWHCVSCGKVLIEIVASYPAETLLPAYQAMRLLAVHLKQSSRAPSYAGTIERVVRRLTKRPAGEEDLAVFILLGGVEALRKVTVLKGTYNQRLEVVRSFLEMVDRAVEENRARKEKVERPRVGKMVVGKGGILRMDLLESEDENHAASVEGLTRRSSSATADAISERQQTQQPSSSKHGSIDKSRKGKSKSFSAPTPSTAPVVTPSPLPTGSKSLANDLDYSLITETTLSQIPFLEDILLPELRRRIEAEDLLLEILPDPEDREEELETPYNWVRRVITPAEDGGAARTEEVRQGEGEETEGMIEVGAATVGAVPQQGQQQMQPVQAGGSTANSGMFGAMSRHMLVSVGRAD
jgi:hypothetical protein